ncbi:hypothetical protein CHUAL_012126 [Chamberlinius hualienensis]
MYYTKLQKTVVEDCGKPDLVQLELERSDNRYAVMDKEEESKWGKKRWLKPSCIPITIILILIILVVLLPLIDQNRSANDQKHVNNFLKNWDKCQNRCRISIVESIPENLTFASGSVNYPSVFNGWMNLIQMAHSTIHIASSYWTLRATASSVRSISRMDKEGEIIFNQLLNAGLKRNISIQIAQDQPSYIQPDVDTQQLSQSGAAEVRSLNFQSLLGAGILHTKFWVVDGQHLYIGSANMDWRSLTQVKEVGIIVYNCSCLAEDLEKIFDIYWMLGVTGATIPPEWPQELETDFNSSHPAVLPLNGTTSQVFFGSSPPPLCTNDRTNDLNAVLHVMDKAEQYIHVAVMDYFPTTLYTRDIIFWPEIDNKIRQMAIEKGIGIKILASHWNHTKSSMPYYLNSLAVLNNSYDRVKIQVKLFIVPSYTKEQAEIPYARVNHNKYMVTDNAAYIGTSNWSGDYFMNTGGASIVVNQTYPFANRSQEEPLRNQLAALFDRDWNSEFAHQLSDFV